MKVTLPCPALPSSLSPTAQIERLVEQFARLGAHAIDDEVLRALPCGEDPRRKYELLFSRPAHEVEMQFDEDTRSLRMTAEIPRLVRIVRGGR